MSWSTDFEDLDAANAARDEYEEYRCPVDDDRRMTTVYWVSDTPEQVRESIETDAMDARGAGTSDGGGGGQPPLTDHERDRIDFSKGRANVLHARSVKGIAAGEGVSDWTAYYDHQLTVDEHREVMAQAAKEGGGKRMDTEDSIEDRAADAAQTVKSEECDHARGHCENVEPEACEFLKDTCDYSEDEVEDILGHADTRAFDEDDTEQTDLVTITYEGEELQVTQTQASAMRSAWQAYTTGVGKLADLIDEVREEIITSRQSMRTINRIRGEEGQDDLHPDRLHDLVDALEDMPGDIPEVRTLDHYQGIVDDADLPKEPRSEEYDTARTIEQGDGADQNEDHAWKWHGSGHSVRVRKTSPHDTGDRSHRVYIEGPDGQTFDVATGVSRDRGQHMRDELKTRLDPNSVSFDRNNTATQQAAAEANRAAAADEGGLLEYTTDQQATGQLSKDRDTLESHGVRGDQAGLPTGAGARSNVTRAPPEEDYAMVRSLSDPTDATTTAQPLTFPAWDGPEHQEDGGIVWRLNRQRMDGGKVAVTVAPGDQSDVWVVSVGFPDALEATTIERTPTKNKALRAANRWLSNNHQRPPGDVRGLQSRRSLSKAPRGEYDTPRTIDQRRDPADALDRSQQALDGNPEPQARLAGGEQGERGQGEVEEHVEENPGGLLADEREDVGGEVEREQGGLEDVGVTEGLRDAKQDDLQQFEDKSE